MWVFFSFAILCIILKTLEKTYTNKWFCITSFCFLFQFIVVILKINLYSMLNSIQNINKKKIQSSSFENVLNDKMWCFFPFISREMKVFVQLCTEIAQTHKHCRIQQSDLPLEGLYYKSAGCIWPWNDILIFRLFKYSSNPSPTFFSFYENESAPFFFFLFFIFSFFRKRGKGLISLLF